MPGSGAGHGGRPPRTYSDRLACLFLPLVYFLLTCCACACSCLLLLPFCSLVTPERHLRRARAHRLPCPEPCPRLTLKPDPDQMVCLLEYALCLFFYRTPLCPPLMHAHLPPLFVSAPIATDPVSTLFLIVPARASGRDCRRHSSVFSPGPPPSFCPFPLHLTLRAALPENTCNPPAYTFISQRREAPLSAAAPPPHAQSGCSRSASPSSHSSWATASAREALKGAPALISE